MESKSPGTSRSDQRIGYSPRKSIQLNQLIGIVENNLYGINKPYGAYLRILDLNLITIIKSSNNYITLRGIPVNTLTIYFIKVDSQHKGKGNFSLLLRELENIAKKEGKSIIIQYVLNPNLENILLKKKYIKLNNNPDYIKL